MVVKAEGFLYLSVHYVKTADYSVLGSDLSAISHHSLLCPSRARWSTGLWREWWLLAQALSALLSQPPAQVSGCILALVMSVGSQDVVV